MSLRTIALSACGFAILAVLPARAAEPSKMPAEKPAQKRWLQRLDKDGDGRLSDAEREEARRRMEGQRGQDKPGRPDGSAPAGAKILRDLEYARVGGTSLRLDLYLPPDAVGIKPMPVIMWVHGGGWQSGSKNTCPLAGLTGQGYAVASINYRLTDQAIFPAQIHDCKGAVRWLRAHASEYGLDSDRIGAAGSSAGGHLVALLGTTGGVQELEGDVGGNVKESSRVQAVCDFCGPAAFIGEPTAVRSQDKQGREAKAVTRLLGGPIAENRDKARLASPVVHVSKDDPPFLIVHGSADPLVPPSQSERLAKALADAGVSVKLEIVDGAGHAVVDKQTVALATKFFEANLKKTVKPATRASH